MSFVVIMVQVLHFNGTNSSAVTISGNLSVFHVDRLAPKKSLANPGFGAGTLFAAYCVDSTRITSNATRTNLFK